MKTHKHLADTVINDYDTEKNLLVYIMLSARNETTFKNPKRVRVGKFTELIAELTKLVWGVISNFSKF